MFAVVGEVVGDALELECAVGVVGRGGMSAVFTFSNCVKLYLTQS